MTPIASRNDRGFTLIELPVVRQRQRAAFTLIELLVVISIISLLIAILLPALASARESARQISCGSTLRQMMIATTGYANENDGYIEPYRSSINDPDFPGYDRFPGLAQYGHYLERFGFIPQNSTGQNPQSKALLCPGSDIRYPDGSAIFSTGNYGLNIQFAGSISDNPAAVSPAFSLDHSHAPSIKILYADSSYYEMSYYRTYNPYFSSSSWHAPRYLPGATENSSLSWSFSVAAGDGDYSSDAIYGRHPGRTVNLAYGDGHVAAVAADDVTYPLKLPVPDRSAFWPD